LLLEEKRDAVRLTAREREVLAWVARGKTNSKSRAYSGSRFLGPIDVEGRDAQSIVSAQS
jgi:hypothetical protein